MFVVSECDNPCRSSVRPSIERSAASRGGDHPPEQCQLSSRVRIGFELPILALIRCGDTLHSPVTGFDRLPGKGHRQGRQGGKGWGYDRNVGCLMCCRLYTIRR